MINKEALEIVINGKPEERLYLCEQDFSLFFTYYYLDYVKYPFAPFHYEMFGDIQDLIVKDTLREAAWIAFRESAKTSISKGVLAWLIAYKQRLYINVDAFDKENAERILFDTVLELQTNEKIKADFGELYNSRRDPNEVSQKRVSNFVTNNGVRVEAHSTQESVRGRLHRNQRPDFLLLDDFETSKTKDSKAYTLQVISHIDEFKAGLDSTAKVLYLGNYITEHGSVQTLMDRSKIDPGLRVRVIPVEQDGMPTWPEKYAMTDEAAKATGKVSLEDKRRQLGSLVYSTEMLNKPIDDSITEFKPHYATHVTEEEVKRMNTTCFVSIDGAVSEKESADYTGVTINRVSEFNKWYVYSYRLKVNPRDFIDHLFYIHKTYNPEMIGIEETTFTLAIKPFLDEEMRKRNTFFNIKMLKHQQIQKETRIRGLIPRWENGGIILVGPNTELKDEMRTFPRGLHDDVLDSLAYQPQMAHRPYDAHRADWQEGLNNKKQVNLAR
jgi:phage terminase large subunit-like protein